MESNLFLQQDTLLEAKTAITASLNTHGVAILPPMDVQDSLNLLQAIRLQPKVTMLDPWYNKGVGGVRDDYKEYIVSILKTAGQGSPNVFLWGFPEIIACFVERIPDPLSLVAWLTWYYKNSPSVIRGWRSSQMACLHLAWPKTELYPEHFLNQAQTEKLIQGKLRYMPGPTSVIEEPFPLDEQNWLIQEEIAGPTDVVEVALLVGFVGKKEQTGHPAQKPVAVYKRLLLMTTKEGDLIADPMSGSGTTGEAARALGRRAIICDHSEEYTSIAEARLGVERISISAPLAEQRTSRKMSEATF